ncbi:hypothetical protein GGF46_002808 [Coemansia sp. RSA 552]|nr:hypothetical protein GGF46_002808 [Coemansia sp. RSA 552]
MTSYSFTTASAAAFVGAPLDGSKSSSAYDGAGHIYRHDSGIGSSSHPSDGSGSGSSSSSSSPGRHHRYGQHLADQRMESHATSDAKDGGGSASSLVDNSVLADYFLKQQALSLGDSSSSEAAAAAAAAAARQTQQYNAKGVGSRDGVAPVNGGGGGQRPSAASATTGLPGTGISAGDASSLSTPATGGGGGDTSTSNSAGGLVDPLPSFLSSLPMPNAAESSKYTTMVAGMHPTHSSTATANNGCQDSGGGRDSVGGDNNASATRRSTPSNGLLAAAAAAAAASVVNNSGGVDAGAAQQQQQHYHHHHHLGYSRHPYTGVSHGSQQPQQQPQQEYSSYTVDGLSFSHNTSASTADLAQSLSGQSAPAISGSTLAAGDAAGVSQQPDMGTYSISAFSRPLGPPTNTAAMLLGGESAGAGYVAAATGNSATPGLISNLSGVSQLSGVHGHYYQQPQQQQPQQQPRSYSDYQSYYRSPSTTLGMGAAAAAAAAATTSTSAAGASPISATGGAVGNGTTQLSAAAAAAAAAAMSPAYYTPATYQQYMRTGIGAGGGTTYPYYYSQTSSRYLPYGPYPPVRHFVSPARPFKCETCEQSFSRNHDLKRHVKIHSGIKPHKCPKCGKSFGRSDALKRHSMVKRCRTSSSSSATGSSSAVGGQGSSSGLSSQRHHSTVSRQDASVTHSMQQQQQPSQHNGVSALTSISGSSRLAPVSSLFGQATAPTMPSSSGSIVSSMLASRANPI